MKGIPAEKPYEGYTLFGPYFHKNEGRWYHQVVKSVTDRFTMTVARYRMSVKMGRILLPEEQVDHIDNNKINDDISNLQILTRLENNRKSSPFYGEGHWIELQCHICQKTFKREYHNRPEVKGIKEVFCSRDCQRKSPESNGAALKYKDENGNEIRPLPHGTKNCYSYHKCRCDLCTEAHRIAKRNEKGRRPVA